MRCEQFELDLNEQLDQRQNPADSEALRDHAAGCRECQQLMDDHAKVSAQLSLRAYPAPSDDFADQVIEAVLVEPKPKKTIIDKVLWAGVGIAGLLFAISMFNGQQEKGGVAKQPKKNDRTEVVNKGQKKESSNQMAARMSVTESLILPPAIHYWQHHEKYNKYFNDAIDSVRKFKAPGKKPQADLNNRPMFVA